MLTVMPTELLVLTSGDAENSISFLHKTKKKIAVTFFFKKKKSLTLKLFLL